MRAFRVLLFSWLLLPLCTAGQGLKDAYRAYFPIGVAVKPADLRGPNAALILREFNSLTAENAMKPGPIHPWPDVFFWNDADAIVDFATQNGLKMRGHTLCWHQQNPPWWFLDEKGDTLSKVLMLKRLSQHIAAVVGRYKGRVYQWDVVNEAVADDGSGLRPSAWWRLCGEDFIAEAFRAAHAADPQAELFYNDYNTEQPAKREAIFALLSRLRAAGVPVHGVGLQGHWSLGSPTPEALRAGIDRFAALGLKVQVTELDVSVYADAAEPQSPYTPEKERLQNRQYEQIFEVLRQKRQHLTGVTFWNVTDAASWLDNFPVRGRKNYPLLFDAQGRRKTAYEAVLPRDRE